MRRRGRKSGQGVDSKECDANAVRLGRSLAQSTVPELSPFVYGRPPPLLPASVLLQTASSDAALAFTIPASPNFNFSEGHHHASSIASSAIGNPEMTKAETKSLTPPTHGRPKSAAAATAVSSLSSQASSAVPLLPGLSVGCLALEAFDMGLHRTEEEEAVRCLQQWARQIAAKNRASARRNALPVLQVFYLFLVFVMFNFMNMFAFKNIY